MFVSIVVLVSSFCDYGWMGKNRSRYESAASSMERGLTESIDDLAAFEVFKKELLKEVREDLLAGKSADEIVRKNAALAAARLVTIAATDADAKNAIAAAKDIIDRSQGKATEKKEITHKYQHLSDEELNSLILSEAQDVEDEESRNVN